MIFMIHKICAWRPAERGTGHDRPHAARVAARCSLRQCCTGAHCAVATAHNTRVVRHLQELPQTVSGVCSTRAQPAVHAVCALLNLQTAGAGTRHAPGPTCAPVRPQPISCAGHVHAGSQEAASLVPADTALSLWLTAWRSCRSGGTPQVTRGFGCVPPAPAHRKPGIKAQRPNLAGAGV